MSTDSEFAYNWNLIPVLHCSVSSLQTLTNVQDVSAHIRDILALFVNNGRKQRPVIHLYLGQLSI